MVDLVDPSGKNWTALLSARSDADVRNVVSKDPKTRGWRVANAEVEPTPTSQPDRGVWHLEPGWSLG